MGKILDRLDVECIDDLECSGRGIWKVEKPFRFQSDILGMTITVEKGFMTDFCSVPRLPFTYWLLGDRAHQSGVIHDWLFHHHDVCDEQTANKVLFEAMVAENIPAWCRILIYLGVVVGGESSWEEDSCGNGHRVIDGRIV